MDHDRAVEAADVLVSLYRGEQSLDCFPDSCRPGSISDAQEILEELAHRMDEPVAGWKCYFPFKAAEPSLFAPIFRVLPSGASITSDMANLRLIEPEVVFRAERDLPPRDSLYTYEEVASAVVAVPAFEFLATRFKPAFAERLGQKNPEVFADNTLSGGFIVGQACAHWRALDFLNMRVVTTYDGIVVSDVTGGHPVKDPFILVFVGVNLMRSTHGVKAGQILATLSPTGLLKAKAGVSIATVFEGFGAVQTSYVN